MIQVIIPTRKEVWFGEDGTDRLTYDPSQVQYLSTDTTDLIDPAVHIGTRCWEGINGWWCQPVLIEVTLVRAKVTKATAKYECDKPDWWVDDLDAVTRSLQMGE